MIKLRIKENGQEKQISFTKRVISFGPLESNADITLEEEGLESPHLLIEETNGRYVVINCANDPKTRFNHLPFGRRSLLSGSKLTVGKVNIDVEYVDDLIEESLGKPLSSSHFEPTQPQTHTPPSKPKHSFSPPEQKLPISMQTLQTIFFSLLMIFFAATGIIGGIYLSSTIQNEEDEIRAARGVSDAAIALLLYAKIHQIRPPNNNWSDSLFLQSVLSSVITQGKPNFVDIDSQGRFKEIPYILRVYTNSDASRFLLVAQPEPQFMGWFHSNEAIVVDSTHMELRKISDIQPINRLIFDSSELSGNEEKRLTIIVKEGDLISLPKLDDQDSCMQFTPPNELALVSPGAENYLYNCPRYYKMTESLLFKSINGEFTKETEQEINRIFELDSPVFYTSEGIKTAVKGYRSLLPILEKKNLNLGYFVHNPKTHIPDHAELLVMSQPTHQKEVEKGAHTPIKVRPSIEKAFAKINTDRKKILQELSDQITEIMRKNNQTPYSEFKQNLLIALREYEQSDIDEQRRIAANLKNLYQEKVQKSKELTAQEFFNLADEAMLSSYIKKQPRAKKNLLKSAQGKMIPSNTVDHL